MDPTWIAPHEKVDLPGSATAEQAEVVGTTVNVVTAGSDEEQNVLLLLVANLLGRTTKVAGVSGTPTTGR